jgi:hypothetical protein
MIAIRAAIESSHQRTARLSGACRAGTTVIEAWLE